MADYDDFDYFNQDQEYQSRQRLDFSNKNLQDAIFSNEDLRGANFTRADLKRANFTGANLEGANFTGAILNGVNFEGANLEGALLPMNAINVASGFDKKKLQKIDICNESGYDNGRGSKCNSILKMLGLTAGKKQRLAKRKTNKRNIKLRKNKTNRHKVNLRKNKTNRNKVSLRKNKTNKKH